MAKMKKKYSKLEDIPAEYASAYVERDGAFVLDTEDDDTPASTPPRLDEFRENNKRLQKELNEREAELGRLKKTYEGVDPEKYKKAASMLEKITADEERELISQGRMDEVVQRRTTSAISQSQEQIKQLQKALENKDKEAGRLRESLGKHVIERDVQIVLGKKGVRVRPGALDDILARTNRAWEIDDKGNSRPVRYENGEKVVRYGNDGNPITMEEYAQMDLLQGAPHLFEPAKGADAPGGTATEPSDGVLRIKASDAEGKSRNLEAIAKGKAKIVKD